MRIVGKFRKFTSDSFQNSDGEKVSYCNMSVLDLDRDEVVKVKPFTSDVEDMAELAEFASGFERDDDVQMIVVTDSKGNVRFRRAVQ